MQFTGVIAKPRLALDSVCTHHARSRVGGLAVTEINDEGTTTSQREGKRGEALVTFDDTKTNVEVLPEATKNAGYPSTVHP